MLVLAAGLLSLNGEQFVENCYLQLLHRHVDPTGRAGYLSQLEAGEDKVTLIECILRSDEGRRVGEQVSGLWTRSIRRRLEKWPMLGAFLPIQTSEIDQALRAIDNKLYRLIEAYATPEASNLGTPGAEPAVDIALLPKPKSLSNEASATSETSVFAAANAKEDFAMSPAPKPQSLPIEESAASLENNLAAARSEPTVATLPILKPQLLPPPPTVTLAKQNHPSIFLLVDARRGPVSGGTGVIGRLGRAFLARGESILFVQWNAEAKNFQLVTRTELAHFELAAGMDEMAAIYPMNNEKPTVIEPSTCGAGDWLLVPEMIRVTTDRPQLLEMDMIMEARRLGLGAAFIFHGAKPLRLKKFAGSDADVYEQYMQALLLADAPAALSVAVCDSIFCTHCMGMDWLMCRLAFSPLRTSTSPPGVTETRS